jgi:hypothetical protein
MNEALHPEHQDLLQFLYQFPVGIIELSEDSVVTMMNPAASRLLSTELDDGESVADPLPVLRRLVPSLFGKLHADPDHIGLVSVGRGEEVDSRDGITRFTVTIHRLRPDHIIIALTDVTEERRLLNEQRARARRLQKALLGRIDLTNLELSVAYLPANRGDLSGGDWYDVVELGGGRYALVVGDVVGHDIEASATMGQLRAIVRAFALVDADPASVLERTENLARTIDGASCATLSYALLDHTTSTIAYSSAGHPPPLVIRADGTSDFLLDGRRPVLAAVETQHQPAAHAGLAQGDIVIMFTDGLVERRGESLDEGLQRLRQTSTDLRKVESIDDLVEQLTAAMVADTNQHDDVCVLAFRHRSGPR